MIIKKHLLNLSTAYFLVLSNIIFASIILDTSLYAEGLFADGAETTYVSNKTNPDLNSNYIFALDLFSDLVHDRINSIIDTLKYTSKNLAFSTLPYLANVSEAHHGIPDTLDSDKRQSLDKILKINPDIASIYFVLPNGNIYLGEPYSHQKQLPRLNFADREWYVGVTALNKTYVSSVFLSASINAPAIAIAVPVLNNSHNSISDLDNNDEFLGYLVGIVNLKLVNELIQNITSDKSNRFFVVDKNGTELVSSIDTSANGTLKQFDFFESLDYNKKTLLNDTNQILISGLNSTLILSKPISFEGGNLIAILVTDNE